MYEDIIELKGDQPGPTSIVLAGVHGDEKCGVVALEKILPSLVLERGRVLIGYGNPEAIMKDVRFVEANLNRLFCPEEQLSQAEKGSLEYGRAQLLKRYMNEAEALLDIHASFNPKSRRFVICEKNALDIAKHLPVSTLVSGFDQVEPGGTDYYMNKIGKIGICLECGYLADPISYDIAQEGLFAFLASRGHINSPISIFKQTSFRMEGLYHTRHQKFKPSKPFEDFEDISEGQLVGMDGPEEVRTAKNGVILFAREVEGIGAEAFLVGERLIESH